MAITIAEHPEPFDDQNICDEDTLIRRVNPIHHTTVDHGRRRLSTKAFSLSSPQLGGGMSVDILRKIIDAGVEPKQFVTNPTYIASVQFPASTIRNLKLIVGSTPLPENPYHGDIWRPNETKFTKGQQNAMLKACTWYFKPEEADFDLI